MKMNESNHTPTPWNVRTDANEFALIGKGPTYIGFIEKDRHEAEANAAFIVRAVNCHDELVAMVDELLAWAKSVEGQAVSRGITDYGTIFKDGRELLAKAKL
jgi:hypothetical protein